jgi:hypothetical protein
MCMLQGELLVVVEDRSSVGCLLVDTLAEPSPRLTLQSLHYHEVHTNWRRQPPTCHWCEYRAIATPFTLHTRYIQQTMKAKDKIWHGFTSLMMTISFYALLSSIRRTRDMLSFNHRLVLASLAALSVGLAKEISDALYNRAIWCNPVCHADVFDILADMMGIAIADVILLVWWQVSIRCNRATSQSDGSAVQMNNVAGDRV